MMQMSPAYVQAITGMKAFNLAVSSGEAIDFLPQLRRALVLGVKPRLLIIGVDEITCEGALDGSQIHLLGDLRLFRLLPGARTVACARAGVGDLQCA